MQCLEVPRAFRYNMDQWNTGRPDTADGSKIFDWLLARCRGLPH